MTATSASRPAKSPPTSWVVKVASAPATRPTSTSSRPGSSCLLPTSWEMLVAEPPGDLLAVDGRVQVDLDVVAVLRPARSTVFSVANRSRRPLTCSSISSSPISSVVDGDLDRRTGPGSVISGPHVDLGGELQRLAVGELGDLDLGPAERLDLVLADRGEDLLRDRLLHRLVEHGAAADPLVDHRRPGPCPGGSRGSAPASRSPGTPSSGSASSSANGTSMASRTRVGLRVSTVLFTGVLLVAIRMWSVTVGVAGFEPTAPRSQSECATKLRHTPWRRQVYAVGCGGCAAGVTRVTLRRSGVCRFARRAAIQYAGPRTRAAGGTRA